jgi:hypothetical protein
MAWFGNDIGGHMAQSIINGTDKLVREPRKEYVYLVYEECHGLIGICGTPKVATEMVNENAIGWDIDPATEPPVYGDGTDGYGWDVINWRREEVLY